MHTTVTCGTCQKRYKVDAKLGGKKATCKNCGASFVIPMAEAAEERPGQELPAEKAAVPESKRKPAGVAPVPAAKAPGGRKPAPPAPKPPVESGEMDFAPEPARTPSAGGNACPSCGKALTEGAKLCVNCGFSLVQGKKVQIALDSKPSGKKGSVPAVADRSVARLPKVLQQKSQSETDFDYRGFRLNKPYEKPFLNTLDTVIPKLAIIVALIACLGVLALIWVPKLRNPELGQTYGYLTATTFVLALYLSITVSLHLIIPAFGIARGANIMKCELPEDRNTRLLATYLVPAMLGFLTLMIMGMGSVLLGVVNQKVSHFGGVALLMAVLASIGVFLLSNFFTFKFFFRLKWMEAVVCYLFFILYFILAEIATSLALAGIGWVLKTVFQAGSA